MKRLLAVAMGMCALGVSFSGFAYAGNEAAGTMILGQVSWVNPDGSHGLVMEDVNAQVSGGSDRDWVNPDGAHGTAGVLDRGPLQAESPFWMNPDGVAGTINGDIKSGEPHRSTAVAASK
jgi:hypothetical protein